MVYFQGLAPSPVDTAFQSVSGLGVTINTEAYNLGGHNTGSVHLPTGVTYTDLVFKRGLKPIPSPLAQWCEMAFERFEFRPLDMVIMLIGGIGTPVKVWKVRNAIPVKYEFGDLDAMNSNIFLETFTLKYNSFSIEAPWESL